MLIDKGVYGSDALSTHALMRGAVLQLHRWGILPSIVAAGTPPVHSTTFSYREQDVTVPIEPKFGVSALYAPRRALLDRLLVNAAVRSGAEVNYRVRVDDVIADPGGRVRGVTATSAGTRWNIDADIVIGADGLHSTIARRVGAPCIVQGRHSTGLLYSYWKASRLTGTTGGSARAQVSVSSRRIMAPCVCSRRCPRIDFAPKSRATSLPHTAG